MSEYDDQDGHDPHQIDHTISLVGGLSGQTFDRCQVADPVIVALQDQVPGVVRPTSRDARAFHMCPVVEEFRKEKTLGGEKERDETGH
jgi:hypothetical protein